MPPELDSLIFDLDGTLWDASATVTAGFRQARQRVSYVHSDITEAAVQAVTGQPYPVVYERLFPELTTEQREEFRQICAQEELLSARRQGGQPYPELRATLEYLAGKYRLFIVSNCQTGYIEAFLAHTQTGRFFEGHLCFGTLHQPKADNVRSIIRHFGLRAPAYVGDTEGDYLAARANGIGFIFAAYGFGEVPEYDARIEQLSDLQELV
ncbi:HAD family hydrolase [Hymenobacter gummosus]|uniref:phosphoglycolate phosphatase n=1 Tax=Hymenobacter gummosus TaxID=1776032 RepID=A0A431U6B3_9BACT|nr:HAD family hydrolase [Hymenobacter gummosus]RTQ51739.1 HAD family hydrolase [Hymenobacter gummosus]